MAHVPPSSIPLPPSPQHSQSEFEALVDLLGTDAPMQSLSTREEEATQSSLRDSEGRLDFNKIKSMFLIESDKLNLDGDKVTPEGQNADALKTFLNDIENIPGDNIFQKGASGNQNDVQNNGNLVDLSEPENMNSRCHTPSPQVMKTENDNPPPFSSLRALLDIAQREAEILRRRCKDLETLILQSGGRLDSYSAGQLDGIQQTNRLGSTAQEITSKGKYTIDAASKTQRTGHYKDFDIDSLSQLETRGLLKHIIDDFSVPPAYLFGILSRSQETNGTESCSKEDLARARDFTLFVDETVWKRSRFGSNYENPLSGDNITALKDRVELWESIVRSRR